MEVAKWVDEDRIDRNMLSDEDQNESHESCYNDFPNLETQESTNSEPRNRSKKAQRKMKTKLQKRASKIG